ncbi:hypothetical protein BU17DRAFT_99147 [Hysterangium stoloniferum]|nr:hypothetical protein BU17DRAFT_99147 [Hysterangium stoloniferum]
MLAIISSINIVGVTFISGVILIVGAAVTIGAVPIIGTVGTVIIGAAFIVGAAVTIGATVTALVRGAALRTLNASANACQSDYSLQRFYLPKYIFPNLYKDPDVFVRCTLAQCVAPLSGTSVRYLEMGQAIKGHGSFKLAHTDEYDDALHEFSRQVFEAAVLWAMKTDKTNSGKLNAQKDNRELLVQLQTGPEEDEAKYLQASKAWDDFTDEIKTFSTSFATWSKEPETVTISLNLPNVLSSFATPSKEPEPESNGANDVWRRAPEAQRCPTNYIHRDEALRSFHQNGSSRRSNIAMDVTDCTTVHAYLTSRHKFILLFSHYPRRSRARPSMSSVRPSSIMPPPPPNPPENRPSSPSVSVVSSTIDGSSSRTRPHLHMGSTDYQKAPAAVGSVKANATGLLVAPSVSRMGIEVEEDDTVLSGRSSPVSNVGTVWAGHRSVQSTKSISMRFNINTLGQLYDENSREAMVDFVPKVHEGPEASVDQIGNLISHSATVNGTAVAPDYAFFVTCSDEGMVLIEPWDIETTSLAETYETRESSPDTSTSTVQIGAAPSVISGIEAEKNPAAAIAALVRSRTALSSPDGATPSAGETDSSRQTFAWT